MFDPVDLLVQSCSPQIASRIILPGYNERRAAAPPQFNHGLTGDWLRKIMGGSDSVWAHQAKALSLIASGANVAIATSTASGKTLPFQAAVIRLMFGSDSTVLLLIPQKALAGDQLVRMRSMFSTAGLSPELIGEINGDVPMHERDNVLERARVILMTPDILQAWLLRQRRSPAAVRYLTRLRLTVIDEAHAFEGIFGSNSAYLIRRLRVAQLEHSPLEPLQFIAATATIAEPADFLEKLTGCAFEVVGEDDNGAPCHTRTLLHVEGPAFGAPAEKMAADMAGAIAAKIGEHAFILFVDSRQGVERIVRLIGRDDIHPYRSGYEGRDRREIEKALRDGALRGIVSTSALELGIDIPQFVVGLNLGVPSSRKALRQRLGRVGRATAGVFAVIAPPQSFAQVGSTFREFYEGPVEPSHLYLQNPIIQFAHARCLLDECEADDDEAGLPDSVSWPEGFAEIWEMAKPGAARPRELDQVALLGGDSPHLQYPLRQICEGKYALRDARTGDVIGTIEADKALREAHPGATYLHMKRAHRVREWRTNSYERSIRLEPVRNAQPTRPLLRTLVNISLDRSEILEEHLLTADCGCLAEIMLRVTESVEGYTTPATILYRDAHKKDPRLSRKQREFATTGVVIRINEPWFAGAGEHQLKGRQAVARAFEQMLTREYNIAQGDVRVAHSGIAICGAGGPRKIDDAVVVFDSAPGGLRLSAPVFTAFPGFLERLSRAADLAGSDALLSSDAVSRLVRWYEHLATSHQPAPFPAAEATGQVIIYAPESRVGIRVRGSLVERTLLEPQYLTMHDGDVLMYRYEAAPGVQAWVPHDQVEAVGQAWQRALWNPLTNQITDLDS